MLVLIPGIPCTPSSWSTWYMSLSPQSQPSTNFAAQHEVGDGERDENCHSLSRPRFDRVITVVTASRTRGLGMAPAGAGTTCMGIQVSCQKVKQRFKTTEKRGLSTVSLKASLRTVITHCWRGWPLLSLATTRLRARRCVFTEEGKC